MALLVALPVAAQRIDGDLSGVVKDSQGAVIPKAKVVITNEATGLSRELETTSVGSFFASNLPSGTYTISVEVAGFRTYLRRGFDVVANRVSQADVVLEVGATVETVEVVAGAELVQTRSATLVGATHTYETLASVGVMAGGTAGTDAGNPINLAIFAPGTTTQPGGMAGQGGSIGGNRPRNNNFTVDGLDNNDPSVTGQNGPVLAEAIKEFTLLTNQFSAEYGHSTAGQFIITTESGTNSIHGKSWWYGQNRHLNSLDNLTRAVTAPGDEKPRYDVNRFGGQVGGPILKDKWFAFGSYEYQTANFAGTPSGLISVPTEAGLATLEGLAATPGSGISPTNVGILRDFVPAAPISTGTQPICNEITNATCAAGGASVGIPVGQFSASTPQFFKIHQFLISTDVQTARHKFSGRFHYSRQRSIFAGALPVEIFNSDTIFDTRRVTYTDVFAINSRMVNEFRIGYMRRTGPDQVVKDIPAPAGTDVFGNYSIDEMSLNIGPQSNFPQDQAGNTYQFADNFSYVTGAHTIKLGVDVRNILRRGGFLPRSRGDYAWRTDSTGATSGAVALSGLDGFVRDTFPNRVSIRGVGSGDFGQNRAAAFFYAGDSWRVHPRVMVEYGLRYEFTQTPRDSDRQEENALASLQTITGQPGFASLSPAHQQALLAHVGNSVIFRRPRADLNNWAPRVGVAWDVFGDGKTSIRAGASRGFDVLFGNLALLQLPPQAQAENREGNACSLLPAPSWCVNAVAGNPLADVSDIRFNTTGFIANGALLTTLPLATSVDPAVARAASANFVVDDKVPEAWTWTLSVQREFLRDWLVEVRYLGTHGLYLPVQRHLNTGIPVYFTDPGLQLPVFTSMSQVPTSFPVGAPTLAGFDAARSTGTSSARMLSPFGFTGALTEFSPIGRSSYHGGTIKVERRFRQGLLLNGNYTWSKTIDMIENELFTSLLNPRRPFDHTDLSIQRGLSGIHREHKFAFSWLYELPRYQGSSGLLQGVMNGWQVSGTYLAESGQPVTVLAFRDINGDADSSALDFVFRNTSGSPGVGSDTQSVCWNGAAVSFGCSTTSQIVGYVSLVDNAEWVIPGRGGQTNSGRGNQIMGGINNWNLEIGKKTPLPGEGRYLEFRAQFINAFNHTSFTIGTGSVFGLNTPAQTNLGYVLPGDSNFLEDNTFSGGLGQAPFQRVIQFGLRVIF
jgi:hypothetical protein